MAEQIIFYVLATLIVFFSVMTVTTRRIIRSATFLLFVLIATAGLYLLIDYHFLAAVQVAVYAGGVMVLFIFSILLTSNPGESVKFEKPGRIFVSLLVALGGLGICSYIIYNNVVKTISYIDHGQIDMKIIGSLMMGTGKYQYLLPFEAVSLLLLACIIGGIMIARKR